LHEIDSKILLVIDLFAVILPFVLVNDKSTLDTMKFNPEISYLSILLLLVSDSGILILNVKDLSSFPFLLSSIEFIVIGASVIGLNESSKLIISAIS
jgi:hypothetical protein